jgi:hypothetical protein
VPGCDALTDGGVAPAFPFRILRAIAAHGPWGLEAFNGTGHLVAIEGPDPAWVFDHQIGVYMACDGAPLPAGSPTCGFHRAVLNLDTGEVCRRVGDGAARWACHGPLPGEAVLTWDGPDRGEQPAARGEP